MLSKDELLIVMDNRRTLKIRGYSKHTSLFHKTNVCWSQKLKKQSYGAVC